MRLHGKSGLVLVGPTFGADASPVAYLSQWSITFDPTQGAEITAITDGHRRYLDTMVAVSGDFTGFYDDASSQLYRQARDGLPRRFYLYPQAAAHDKYFAGTILPDFAVGGGESEAVAIRASWVAAGDVEEFVTDFVINVTASVNGQGRVSVLPPGTTSIAGASQISVTPIISVTAALAGAGVAGAIPRTASLVGTGSVAAVVPILSGQPPAAGAGRATATPTLVMISALLEGVGGCLAPGQLAPVAIGGGAAGAIPTIGALTTTAGVGAATASATGAIQAGAAIAGLGTCTASYAIISPPYAVPAAPGRTWKRYFHRSHQMMPATPGGISFRVGSGATQSGAGTSLSITIPAVCQPGDVLIFASYGFDSPKDSYTTNGAGTLATLRGVAFDVGDGAYLGSYVVAAGDAGSKAISLGGGGSGTRCFALAGYVGVNNASPVDVNATPNTTTTSSVTAPTINTVAAGDWALEVMAGAANGGSISTQPATNRASTSVSAAFASVCDSSGPKGAGVSIGGDTFTLTGATSPVLAGFTIGLRSG